MKIFVGAVTFLALFQMGLAVPRDISDSRKDHSKCSNSYVCNANLQLLGRDSVGSPQPVRRHGVGSLQIEQSLQRRDEGNGVEGQRGDPKSQLCNGAGVSKNTNGGKTYIYHSSSSTIDF